MEDHARSTDDDHRGEASGTGKPDGSVKSGRHAIRIEATNPALLAGVTPEPDVTIDIGTDIRPHLLTVWKVGEERYAFTSANAEQFLQRGVESLDAFHKILGDWSMIELSTLRIIKTPSRKKDVLTWANIGTCFARGPETAREWFATRYQDLFQASCAMFAGRTT